MANPLNISHRGFSAKAPENTMIAFRHALEAGADGIEFDVQVSLDGIPVIIHDEQVDRTTNHKGYIKDFTFQQLRQMDAGSWFAPEFAGESIPSLEEVFHVFGRHFRLLNIELKSGIVQYPQIEAKVIQLVRKYRLEQSVLISSFNHHSLRTLKMQAPDLPIGLLYLEGLVEPWHYAMSMRASALHPFYINITPELVYGAHRYDIALNPFTVNDEETMKLMIAAGVDGIITDHPDRLAKLL